MSKRDELVQALSGRLLSFTTLYDADAVLAPETASLARALMACVPDPSRDREAVLTAAELYYLRALLLDEDDDGPDAVIAAALARMAGIVPAGPGMRASLWGVIEAGRAAETLLAAGGDLRALAEAVDALRAALASVPEDLLAFRGRPLAILGAALFESYERTGSLPDLHDAIRAFREAEAATTATTHPGWRQVVSQLGVALRTRYERAGALDDLDESVERARQVAVATSAGDFNRAGRLHNLGIALRLRYERTDSRQDLDEAIRVCREAVTSAGPGHPGYVIVRSGLRNALLVRADRDGETAGYAEIVALDEQALLAAPPGSELRVKVQVNLAATLTRRYEAEGTAGDADRAIALLHEARAAVPDGHALVTGTQYQLAMVRWARYGRLGDRRELDAAVSCMRAAAGRPAGPPWTRWWAAVAWGRWALTAGDARQALAGYEQAIELLPALTPRNLARSDAEHALSRLSGLASDAAAAAIAAGNPERAVVLLEQGRGILLARDLQTRDDVAELREQAPRLAARFLELRAALGAADASLYLAGPGETAGDLRHVLAADWDRLLTEIRALPGFTDFLRPPPFGRLLEQAAHGPVVLVNVSRHRCDALVLTSGGLLVVPLPGLTLADALRRTVAFLTVLEQPGSRDDAREAELSAGLAWLWDTMAGPVLDALGITGPPAPGGSWPRVWWVPTGPLAFLPLHAAGYHGTADGRNVLDRVVSSYAPTLRTLAYARRPAQSEPASFLVVAVPAAPGARRLRGAAREADELTALLPGARLLRDAGATREGVIAGIREHSWLHFSGHGRADAGRPSESQLIVQDHAAHPLTVVDISRLNLDAAEFAYLSACTTARSGFGLADEALHLASAMQLAGYRHVVGTLWEIGDAVAVVVARRVYAALGAPRPAAGRAAFAVHAAVREVRDQYPSVPSLWAAHVHVGP